MDDEKAEAYLVELYQSIEHSIDLLKDYGAGRLRYLRIRDVNEIIMILRNYRREKFGNPITDRERRE